MRKDLFLKVRLLLIVFLLIWADQTVCGQDAQSKVVKFKISNIPDFTPPAIKIIAPLISDSMSYLSNTEEIVLIGEVKDSSGVKFISVNDDIREMNEAGIFSARIYLTPGINKVQVLAADNEDNLQEQYVTIDYNSPVLSLADRIKESSRYYGLIIGIDEYQDQNLPDLDNPINDAMNLYNALLSNYTFEDNNVLFLRNATRTDIVNALDYLSNTVTQDDNLLIFYAGHGNWDERADVGYWLPTDAHLSSSANWFRNSTLVDYLKQIDSKHTLLITDACFAGSIFKSRSGFPNQDRAYEIMYDLTSRKAMTSGTLTEVPDRSPFTRYLLERLNENEDTYLSSWELFNSFRIAVINNSEALPQYGEIQNVGDEGGDFIFLRKK
jgi:hypothetical protein